MRLTRRQFVASTSAASLAAVATNASAIGPIARNGEAKFKFSLEMRRPVVTGRPVDRRY